MYAQLDLFPRLAWLPPCGWSSLPFCEVTVAVSSLGDEYHCMTCDCSGRVPLTALST